MNKSLLAFAAFALAACAAFHAPPAQATDVTLTWTAPTTNSDGSTPALIGGYNIYAASTDAALTALPNSLAGGKPNSVGKVLTYTYKAAAPGTYFYALTTWYCPPTGGQAACVESAQSAHVTTTVTAPVISPGVPGKVSISATVAAPPK